MTNQLQILFNAQQLREVCALIPYPIRAVDDPDKIAYPTIVKFILLREQDIGEIVYVVTFDSGDLLCFYEEIARRIEKPGIEGYKYAESEEDSTGTGREIQAEFDLDFGKDGTDNIRPAFLSDDHS